MIDESSQSLSIRDLYSILPHFDRYAVGDDIFLYDTHSSGDVPQQERLEHAINHPLRFNGYLSIFCLQGDMTVDINLRSFPLKPGTLLFTVPGNIIRVERYNPELLDSSHFILIGLSKEFVSSIHFDFNKMFHEALTLMDTPSFTLDEQQFDLAKRYFVLGQQLMNPVLANRKESLGSLLTSLLYIMGGFWSKSISEAKVDLSGQSARVKQIFDRFIALVTEHHTQERGMAFYADKLCLTPKYLSKLVKQASGRSAPEWIDAFVILEAKNMLKYSNMAIKEIVYRLNFPNQSVFYKFFKSHTGMTPSEYRNA